MVQLTVDTTNDSLEELEQAKKMLEQAIARRGKKLDMPAVNQEEIVDTPFLKVTVKEDHVEEKRENPNIPTLNQLLSDESLTEDDLAKLYKEVAPEAPIKKEENNEEVIEDNSNDGYIEIVEYEEK